MARSKGPRTSSQKDIAVKLSRQLKTKRADLSNTSAELLSSEIKTDPDVVMISDSEEEIPRKNLRGGGNAMVRPSTSLRPAATSRSLRPAAISRPVASSTPVASSREPDAPLSSTGANSEDDITVHNSTDNEDHEREEDRIHFKGKNGSIVTRYRPGKLQRIKKKHLLTLSFIQESRR